MKNPKKKVFTQTIQNFSPVFGQKSALATVSVLKPSAQVTKGGPCYNFAYYSMVIILSWRRAAKTGAWGDNDPGPIGFRKAELELGPIEMTLRS